MTAARPPSIACLWHSAAVTPRPIEAAGRSDARRLPERALEQFLDGVPLGLLVREAAGRPVYANEAVRAILGYGVEDGPQQAGVVAPGTFLPGRDVPFAREDLPMVRALRGESSLAEIDIVRAGVRRRYRVLGTPILDDDGAVLYGLIAHVDVTQEWQTQVRLERQAQELKKSNAELEQFAYVASHDLQEPLRMVASYMQLLSRRYAGQLDADADEFIGYAVDGANRMQQLINDLLAYSRIGRQEKRFAPVDTEVVLKRVTMILQLALADADASVVYGDLPTVVGAAGLLEQLFQNLIGNAIKFHGEDKPVVHVTAETGADEWVFCVADNGIGIAPEYAERIFMMFQRLGNRETYAGTGIGLAICKRIVEQHGGRLWVEPNPEGGSQFLFSVPFRQEGRDDGSA